MNRRIIDVWKQKAKQLKTEIYAIYLAYNDKRVPIYAKILAICIVGYAFSPIDLIPDFIPVLGYLDDFILLPLGIYIIIKMIPEPVLDEYREKAKLLLNQDKPVNWLAGGIIFLIWITVLLLFAIFVVKVFIN